jgi:hypothetical protein
VTRRARQNKRSGNGGNKPPQIQSNVTLSHRFRFVSTSGTATSVTPTTLLGAAGTIGTVVNSRVVPMMESIRVREVSIWTPPASQGAAATCSVLWVGIANQSNNMEVSDTTVSTATPAHIKTFPPRNSLASFWQQASNTSLFTVTAPSGSIIDVSLDMIVGDDENNITIFVVTATLGATYFLALDGTSTNRFIPVSLTTTS